MLITSTFPLQWKTMKRSLSLGEGRGASPPHTRQPTAYMSFASCKLAPLAKVKKRLVNTDTSVIHAYPWGCLGIFSSHYLQSQHLASPVGAPRDDHDVENIPILTSHDLYTSDAERVEECATCIQGKLIRPPSRWKLPTKMPTALYRLHSDWWGPIIPQSGQFKYFFVLIDASLFLLVLVSPGIGKASSISCATFAERRISAYTFARILPVTSLDTQTLASRQTPFQASLKPAISSSKNGAPISWCSTKQTVTATFTNHVELLSLHEASREAVWLRTMQHAILQMSGLPLMDKPTTIFEDNAACIEQVSFGFIKADRVKHISPHLFGYTQDLTETKQIEIKKIASTNNIADVLTKALPTPQHHKLIIAAGMRTLTELEWIRWQTMTYFFSFTSSWSFLMRKIIVRGGVLRQDECHSFTLRFHP